MLAANPAIAFHAFIGCVWLEPSALRCLGANRPSALVAGRLNRSYE